LNLNSPELFLITQYSTLLIYHLSQLSQIYFSYKQHLLRRQTYGNEKGASLDNLNLQQKKEANAQRTQNAKKMPLYKCSCGTEILIIPNLAAMVTAIHNHIAEHKKITGQSLNEEEITQGILKTICEN
jgi:hypothetical protein